MNKNLFPIQRIAVLTKFADKIGIAAAYDTFTKSMRIRYVLIDSTKQGMASNVFEDSFTIENYSEPDNQQLIKDNLAEKLNVIFV